MSESEIKKCTYCEEIITKHQTHYTGTICQNNAMCVDFVICRDCSTCCVNIRDIYENGE